MGKPIIAMYNGVVTSVHNHNSYPTFGNHFHYKIVGPWGERWIHHAHCLNIYVKVNQVIKEGDVIATIGNSGTNWAHDHWAIKKVWVSADAIARNKTELANWENPVQFVQKWKDYIPGGDDMTDDERRALQVLKSFITNSTDSNNNPFGNLEGYANTLAQDAYRAWKNPPQVPPVNNTTLIELKQVLQKVLA